MAQAPPTRPLPATASSAAPASVSSVAPIGFAASDAAAVRTPSSADAWGGVHTGMQAPLSDRVVSYQIDATLHPDTHIVDARQHMTWRNRSDRPVHAVYLHMYLNAFEGPGSTFFTERRLLAQGHSRGKAKLKAGQWGHIQLNSVSQGDAPVRWRFVHPDGGPTSDHTVVRLELAQAVPAHGTLSLDMDFTDKLPRVVERTGWFGKFHLVAQWFPKIGVLELPGERGATQPQWNVHAFHFNSEFYADYGRYDVHLTVPKGYTVGAVGRQQGKPVAHDGQQTYHFVQDDVHDFAWVAAPGYRVLQGSYDGAGSPHVKVKVIYPPEYSASAAPVLKATIDALGYFSKTLGPYPYHTVTAVVPPYNAGEAGGMEYPTFFTAEGYKSVPEGTLTQVLLDFVTIHEFGHGYFYGILGSNEFEEPMLDEGLNEFWDQRMLRARGQLIDLTSPFLKLLGFDPKVPPFVYERFAGVRLLDPPADPTGANSWDRMNSESYGTVYSRTATVMHDLESRIGSEALEKGFRAYYQRWRFRHPSVADLEQSLAEASGKPEVVHQLFDQQVYATHHVDDRVGAFSSEEVLPQPGSQFKGGHWQVTTAADVRATIARTRKQWKANHPDAKPGTGPYPWQTVVVLRHDGAAMAQTVRVNFADGSHIERTWDSAAPWQRMVFERPVRAVSVQIDPARKAYLDANKLNDSRTLKADGAASRRWTAQASALLETLFGSLETL
ncbi:M1 family metallopeptidase [Oleiagrimonas sp. C23AA]|nr:M1 family metallopeptidase [Oleiagrimonas sp. C23AA]